MKRRAKWPASALLFLYADKYFVEATGIGGPSVKVGEWDWSIKGRFVDGGQTGLWVSDWIRQVGLVPLTPAARAMLAIAKQARR